MTKRLLAAVCTVILSATVYGQPMDGYDGSVAKTAPVTDWWTVLYFVVACLGVAVVAFKSAHRTHLD